MFMTTSQRLLRPAFTTMRRTRIAEPGVAKVLRLASPTNEATYEVTRLSQFNCRNFSSVLSGKHGVSRKDNMPTKQMPATTMVPGAAMETLNQSQAMLGEESTQHAQEIAESVGVRLTPNELSSLREKLADSPQESLKEQMQILGQEALSRKATREICLSVICSNDNPMDKWGVRIINFFDYLGTALFAVVGAQVAGDAGMNLVGCSLVGCAAAMGGGSLNALLYGGTNPLLANSPGVRWVANPSFLIVALLAAVGTFFVWPYYCQTKANRYIEDAIGKDNIEDTDTIGEDAFLAAWHHHPTFQQAIKDALPNLQYTNKRAIDPEAIRVEEGLAYFRYIDSNASGDIDRRELQELIQERFHNGWETYWLDTFGLTSLSLASVVGAIRCGLHPIVAATSGVTVCFGGILRDILCGRELKIGSQSYAFATGASSATYILLRELTIRRILILPLVVRTFISAGACIGLRGYEFLTGKPILRPMHS